MKIATILPTDHLYLEREAEYHLCLAHQVLQDSAYMSFFINQARRSYVMLDNGAAENGVPMDTETLIDLICAVGCQEVVLPDTIYDARATLAASREAFLRIKKEALSVRVMAVPHGKTQRMWRECALEMMSWGVDTIGISKFIAPHLFPSRVQAILTLPELFEQRLRNQEGAIEVHLLGYTGIKGELSASQQILPCVIRGVDSSIATLYAQIGRYLLLEEERPDVILDLNAALDKDLLWNNIRRWKELCSI